MRILYPLLEVFRGVRQSFRGDIHLTTDMRQIRRDLRGGTGAANGVAHHAFGAKEHVLASKGGFGFRLPGGLTLVFKPAFKLARFFGDDAQSHLCVLMTAELRALPAIYPRLIRLDDQRHVALRRKQVALAGKIGHPEAVDHIFRGKLQQYRCPCGNVQFV